MINGDDDWDGEDGGLAPQDWNDTGANATFDGLPGVLVPGSPGLRAGAWGHADNLLGLIRVEELAAKAGQGGGAGPGPLNPKSSGPTLAWDGHQANPMPGAYVADGHGGVQLRPDFAAAHPNGPFDFGGMAGEIHWPGVVKSGIDIVTGGVNSKIHDWIGDLAGVPSWADLPKQGIEVWKSQDEANSDPAHPPPGADRATNGLP